ncbi:RNA helicase [Terrabacter sp. 28]|nr:RNA helicase [Terrabacter sp. 28]
MPLEVVYGESRDRVQALSLAQKVGSAVHDGTLYLGYPVLSTPEDRVEVDALLVGPQHGLVAFLLRDSPPRGGDEWSDAVEEQERLYGVLESQLGRHPHLRRGRRLAVDIHTFTVYPTPAEPPETVEEGVYCGMDEVPDKLGTLDEIGDELYRGVQASLQRVSTIKPSKKRAKVQKTDSRGAKLKEIERGIANLDKWQKQAAIETPEGPQRIRGLAGSGKTIVLALKAAYLHAMNPEWRIALTFQSRSLYQQLEDLVTRFSFEHSNDTPDFSQLRIMHAWGGSGRDGIYRDIALSIGFTPRDWGSARAKWGYDDAFKGACAELLSASSEIDAQPIYDAVLVDEAQDLPPEFFQLIYKFTKDPKRVVWGYDELQKLNEAAMPTTEELFGTDDAGRPLVDLQARSGEARRDIILPVCYRNTPWALATAHSLGFGIYRAEGLVQHFDNPHLWDEIGYEVADGGLGPGEAVDLVRSPRHSPEYFDRLLDPSDALTLHTFADEAAQDMWVAQQIKRNLEEDELEIDDILIVIPDQYTAKSRAPRLARVLAGQKIPSHMVGVNSSTDEVFREGSVAIAHIFRAKGNEAPMVYVIDSQYGAEEFNAVSRRNKLFTGITRSRAWVRIAGHGPKMESIAAEVKAVQNNGFHLRFNIPTDEELAKLRRLHRDRTMQEIARVESASKAMLDLLSAVERSEIEIEDLPLTLRRNLLRRLGGTADEGDE